MKANKVTEMIENECSENADLCVRDENGNLYKITGTNSDSSLGYEVAVLDIKKVN